MTPPTALDALLYREVRPDAVLAEMRRAWLEQQSRKAARELSRRYLGKNVKYIPPLPGQLDMLAADG